LRKRSAVCEERRRVRELRVGAHHHHLPTELLTAAASAPVPAAT
jgi:hypothetical protein